ncbi:MAG: hypothetical protein FWE61_11635, partial [Micrococcales bacterium]|nr:hypothetical protein [Micrococcales bacterium]
MPQDTPGDITNDRIFLKLADAMRRWDEDCLEDEATQVALVVAARFVRGDGTEDELDPCDAFLGAFANDRRWPDTLRWLSPAQQRRLAELFTREAALTGRWDLPAPALKVDVPRWFVVFQSRLTMDVWPSPSQLYMWDPAFFVPLLAVDDPEHDLVTQHAVSTFFALQHGKDDWARSAKKYPAHAQAWVDYLHDNASAVPPAVMSLDVAGRVAALAWLGLYPQLAAVVAPMLGELAVGLSRPVRESAASLIATLDEPLRSKTLATALAAAKDKTIEAVIVAAAGLGEPGRALLADALAERRGGRRDALLAGALGTGQAAEPAADPALVVPPLAPLDNTPVGDELVATLQAACQRRVTQLEVQLAAEHDPDRHNQLTQQLAKAQGVTTSDINAACRWLNGDASRTTLVENLLRHGVLKVHQLRLPLVSAIRLVTRGKHTNWREVVQPGRWYAGPRYVDRDYDLRHVLEAARAAGVPNPVAAVEEVGFVGGLAPGLVWPFFVEHPQRLDEELGLSPLSSRSRDRAAGLRVLATFPVVPAKYVQVLADLALGQGLTDRREAQQLLERLPQVLDIAATGLSSSKGGVRAVAATWIGQIGDDTGTDLLRDALATETRDEPKTAMIHALHALGQDVSAYLTPQVLATAATAGLKTKIPPAIDWFPVDQLPQCRWADATPVDRQTIWWWVVRAATLKDPAGAPETRLHLSLLDNDSRERLGAFVA